MQEEVENRTLTLIVSGTKFTGRLFKAAISKYMAHRKEKKLEKQRSRDSPVTPKGKQTVKQLIGQNQGVSNIEINDPSIDFEMEPVVLPQIASIKQASAVMGLPVYYLRRLCKEVPGIAFQSGVKWYINLGRLADYYNGRLAEPKA